MRKKLLILALALISLMSLTLGVSAFSALADETANTPQTVNLTMDDGAYVRISDKDDKTGMRYVMQMPASEYEALKANENYTVSFGILIAPSVYEERIGELSVENVFGTDAKYDWAIEQEDGTFEYSGSKTRIMNLMTDEMIKTDDTYSFYGCIYEVKDENIAADFIGKGYIKYTYTEGETQKTEYRFASVAKDYEESEAKEYKVTRSMALVAQKACAAEGALSEDQKSTIQSRYLDKVKDVEKTYTVETYDSDGKLLSSDKKMGKLGTPATAETEEVKRTENDEINCYVYDSANTKNQVTGTVWADGSLVLKRFYKSSSMIYKSYSDFSKTYTDNGEVKSSYSYDSYSGYPGWNDGNRITVGMLSASKANDSSDLSEAVKSETESLGGVFHVLNNGVSFGASTYYNWGSENIDDDFRKKADNIMLPGDWRTGLPEDYTAVSYRVYVESYENTTATYGVYTGSGAKHTKNLAEGWNTIYLAKSDFDSILTASWEVGTHRLPMGLFTNVKELYLAYVGVEFGSTHNLLVKDAGDETAEAKEVNFGWSISADSMAIGYTFFDCNYDADGQQLLSDVLFATSGKAIYAHYIEGTLLYTFNESQNIAVDTMETKYNWSYGNRNNSNTSKMFESKDSISSDIASGMYVGSKGMLHVISDGKVNGGENENSATSRTIWFRTGYEELPETYTSIIIRVYVESTEGNTAAHYVHTGNNDSEKTDAITLTAGWNTIEISKEWEEKAMFSGTTGEGVPYKYFGIGHFDNVKNLYIDYIAVKK